ncbi:ribonuclease D [Bartonella henselae]|nr:ribonuclease D [Bartonella henselae]ATP13148.1 ribonuclease D [Bartonella henselae]MDM9983104.1 ribonuclease D [Bartonella henselae]MDM9984549.1 ribonuclease D [Bartonella henselae]MDM9986423.1 ribonuclease D [Bartonella henselae]MDM9987765.1 ribonuclease D [Bartonella henselae]
MMKLITQTTDLEIALATLRNSDFVTIDTEFIRETTFWPQLCLIQLASPDTTVLIDPISQDIDLKPFFDLMVNKKIVKVFHAARQDIETIYHLGGVIPSPLFDTQIAGSICGFGDSISYDQIVQRCTGYQLDKSSRFTDWSFRPLSEKQLLYALADVTYLRDVYLLLKKQLEKNKRTHWMDDEIAVLLEPKTYDMPENEAWKKVKGKIKKPRELAVLQKIAAWRERKARQYNIPRRHIIKDECLIEIAIQQPKDEADLKRLRSLNKNWDKFSIAHTLIKAVHEGLEVDLATLPALPKHNPLNETSSAVIDLLKVLLKLVANENGIAPKIIATSNDLEKIANGCIKKNIPAMNGWRYEIFGQKAEQMLKGKIGFYLSNGKINTKQL